MKKEKWRQYFLNRADVPNRLRNVTIPVLLAIFALGSPLYPYPTSKLQLVKDLIYSGLVGYIIVTLVPVVVWGRSWRRWLAVFLELLSAFFLFGMLDAWYSRAGIFWHAP